MRNKTYHNFMRVWNTLQKTHGYEKEEARKLAHIVFENVELDKGYGNRTAEEFLAKILPAKEFYAQCERR